MHWRGWRIGRKTLWFLGMVLLFPALAIIYLICLPPQSYEGSNYKTVELASIVGTPVEHAALANEVYPDNIRSLDDKLVAIQGEMLVPAGGQLAPNEFLLIDRATNPGGSVKSPWQYVLVRMPPEKKVQRIMAPMQLFGKFHAKICRDPAGRVTSMYELDVDWMLVR